MNTVILCVKKAIVAQFVADDLYTKNIFNQLKSCLPKIKSIMSLHPKPIFWSL